MRILAVTADASLITALTSMMLDWEIVHVNDPADAKPRSEDAVVTLIDSGTTERGIETAKTVWSNGVTLPSLVIGDSDPPEGTRVRVLVRPFSLHDLTSAVDEVSKAAPIDPGRAIGQEPPAESEVEQPSAATEAEPAAAERAVVEEPVSSEPQTGADDRAVRGSDLSEASTTAQSIAAELEAIAEPPVAVGPEEEPEEPAGAIPEAVQPTPEPEPRPGSRRIRVFEPEPDPEPVLPTEPELQQPIDEPEDSRYAEPERAAPRVIPARPAVEAAKAEGGLRRFLRRRDQEPTAEAEPAAEAADPMFARLTDAIAALREVEALVTELPVLAQPRAMAHAFLGEVVEMFAPQVAAVFAQNIGGTYGVIAAHGLSSVEVGLKVPADQPLFAEMARTLEAVLVAPVDLAQGLVAGIGGARTEALMAAPMAVGDACHAIVMVGRQDFSEFDLELLAEQAEEAAPGLAVAQLIDRLRGL